MLYWELDSTSLFFIVLSHTVTMPDLGQGIFTRSRRRGVSLSPHPSSWRQIASLWWFSGQHKDSTLIFLFFGSSLKFFNRCRCRCRCNNLQYFFLCGETSTRDICPVLSNKGANSDRSGARRGARHQEANQQHMGLKTLSLTLCNRNLKSTIPKPSVIFVMMN